MFPFRFRIRIAHHRTIVHLTLLTAFCFALLIIRMVWTQSMEYRFMGINLMLAWIPYIFALRIERIAPKKQIAKQIIFSFLWLLFFPNAAYMITDIIHLPEFPSAPMWFDLMLLLSFAWCGLLLSLYSLRIMHQRYLERKSAYENLLIIFGIFFIGGIGIYLGRYARWNSWDLILSPVQQFNDLVGMLANPYILATMLSLGFLFGTFCTFVYLQLFRSANIDAEKSN